MSKDAFTSVLETIQEVVRETRFTYENETQLQAALQTEFLRRGLPAQREVALSNDAGRIDFLIESIGVEVKIGGQRISVIRQLQRYLSAAEVGAIVLVTTKAAHLNIPAVLANKPVLIASMLGAGL